MPWLCIVFLSFLAVIWEAASIKDDQTTIYISLEFYSSYLRVFYLYFSMSEILQFIFKDHS